MEKKGKKKEEKTLIVHG